MSVNSKRWYNKSYQQIQWIIKLAQSLHIFNLRVILLAITFIEFEADGNLNNYSFLYVIIVFYDNKYLPISAIRKLYMSF